MKKLPLNNISFEYLQKGFEEWLDILGYCNQSVYNFPHYAREFLHFLEKLGLKQITQLEQQHIKQYHKHLSSRPNQRRGGGLSAKYIHMHLYSLEKLLEYLNHKGVQNLPTIGIRLTTPKRPEITVLTLEEIQQLFAVTKKEVTHLPNSPYQHLQESINSRDRAMLVIYYSCGLRRTEGVSIHVDDINLETRVLHVRKGKNYKERFVPFNKTNAKYLEEYIYDHRPILVRRRKERELFISANTATPMYSGSLYSRLKMLQSYCDDIQFKQKEIGLHTLRHSIATHLLQAGMPLEKIARFLGHSTMDSTQIYTHLIEKEG